jgi:hypothetical protein
MQLLSFVLAMVMASSGSALGDTITVSPPIPTSETTTTLVIDGVSPAFLGAVILHQTLIQGESITVEACYPNSSFPGPGPYQLRVALGVLAPGAYSAQYATAFCDPQGVPVTTFIVQATSTFTVLPAGNNLEAIPSLNALGLTVLAAILGAVAWLELRSRA